MEDKQRWWGRIETWQQVCVKTRAIWLWGFANWGLWLKVKQTKALSCLLSHLSTDMILWRRPDQTRPDQTTPTHIPKLYKQHCPFSFYLLGNQTSSCCLGWFFSLVLLELIRIDICFRAMYLPAFSSNSHVSFPINSCINLLHHLLFYLYTMCFHSFSFGFRPCLEKCYFDWR